MSTKRLQIRDALAALAATATGLTPYLNLDFAIEDMNLPALAITSERDAVDGEASSMLSAAPEIVRANFLIHVMVSRSADPEAEADGFEELVRGAFSGSSLGGMAMSVRYHGGDWVFDLGDSAVRRLHFEATFIS